MVAPKNKIDPAFGIEIPTRCVVCGQVIHEGEPCEASKQKGAGTVYAHTECIKQRKERKE